MNRLLPVLFLLSALSVNAAERITLWLVITNPPIGNTNSITWNGSARLFTNSVTGAPATLVQETNSIPWTSTNIQNQFTFYKATPGNIISGGTNFVRVAPGAGDANPTLSINACCWGYITNSTQTVATPTFQVRVPITAEASSNQVHIASLLVKGMSDSSTNAFATNSTAISNALQKGAGPLQRVDSPVTFGGQVGTSISSQTNVGLYNATNRGYIAAVTNGYWTNGTFANPVMTNATNYGLAFSSPGAYPFSQQFGGGQVGAGYAMAIGEGAFAGTNSLAVGNLASGGHFTVAIGNGADGSGGTNGVAIGQNTGLGASSNSVAIGQSAQVGDRHHGSVALGQGSTTTTNLQVMLGGSTHMVVVPGVLQVTGTATNTTLRGTNVLNGRVDVTPRENASLANGYNSGVIFGTNFHIRFSGPSGAYTNVGFVAPGGPQMVWASFDNPGISFTLLNESGLEATAGNRILTETGALLNSTNRVVHAGFLYDVTASRWRVISFR